LVKQREKYRKAQNWQKADQIRQEIANLGFAIKDTANGPIINKVLSKRSQE
jgi:cysteinyl-tRNA synthetase